MRYVAIIGVGFGMSVVGACGGTDSEHSTRTSKNVPCQTDLDCNGGELCEQGACISARLVTGSGGASFGNGGSVASGGSVIGTGGFIGGGGFVPGTGGL